MILQEIVTRLGFTVDPKNKKKYDDMVNQAGQKAKAIGSAISGAIFGAFIKKAWQEFANFDAQIRQTAAVMGLQVDQIKKLTEQARELGRTTRFSATEAAQAQTELAKAGLDTNQIFAAMPSTLNLAINGQLGIAEAAGLTTVALSNFGLEATETTKVADILATVASSANTDIRMLGEAIAEGGNVAKSSNQSIEQFARQVGLLANAGIQGSKAGTLMKNIYTRLTKDFTMSGSRLKKFGINIEDSSGKMRDAIDIVRDFAKATESLGSTQQSKVFIDTFGLIALPAVTAIANASSESLDKLTGKIADFNGKSQQMASDLNKGPLAALTMLKSAFSGFLEAFGKQMTVIELGLNKLTDFFSFLAGLNESTLKFAANTTIAAAGLGLWIAMFSSATWAMQAFGKAAIVAYAKALLLPLALAAIGVAAGVVIQDIITFANGGDSVLGRMAERFPELNQMLQDMSAWWKENGQDVKEFGYFLLELAKIAAQGFAQMALMLIDWGMKAIPVFAQYVSMAIEAFDIITTGFADLWTDLNERLDKLAIAFNAFWNDIASGANWINDLFTQIFGITIPELFNSILSLFEPITNMFTNIEIPEWLTGFLSGSLERLKPLGFLGDLNPATATVGGVTNNSNLANQNVNQNNRVNQTINVTPDQVKNVAPQAKNGVEQGLNASLANIARSQPRVIR